MQIAKGVKREMAPFKSYDYNPSVHNIKFCLIIIHITCCYKSLIYNHDFVLYAIEIMSILIFDGTLYHPI